MHDLLETMHFWGVKTTYMYNQFHVTTIQIYNTQCKLFSFHLYVWQQTHLIYNAIVLLTTITCILKCVISINKRCICIILNIEMFCWFCLSSLIKNMLNICLISVSFLYCRNGLNMIIQIDKIRGFDRR